MTRQFLHGHRASSRATRGTHAAFVGLAAMAGVALAAVPAGAQWIGTPGGSGDSTPPAMSTTPAPAATAPAATAPAPSLSPDGMASDLGSAGLAAPSLSSPSAMPGGGAQPSGDMADCQTNVNKLRGDLESRGNALQAATKKKRPPSELCPLFRNFASSQQKFLSYLRTNKTKCGVPDEVLSKLRENTNGVVGVRDKVCKVAADMQSGGGAAGGGAPPQSSVASGLGLSSGLPGVSANKPGGVFDTLGGSALR
ncbi:hypothetical protein [Ancylobacter oerskovii]|uniref:Uncharacterized protein n=1 Tax=Ancylobacter oerskovii TaxID=459519 RepID=A0ABW4YT51_9HYPH|nr:hypothetical protein [Ancylobacter oerskovii]MBS7543417.1 hypothetical protein [Ancylobacter oerskovii]